MRYNPDGSEERVYAKGLRNAVGITFNPLTGELWATNNGRDFLGDDLPPETVYLVKEGADYGWPGCHSGRIVDPQFGSSSSCEGIEEPEVEMQAHSAPLGLEFYSGDQYPAEYQGDLFVAFHGSWNRSQPVGYKIVRIPMHGETIGLVEDFAVGWLVNGASWGRPVDIITAPDGSLLISDDAGGTIYRIYYRGP
jgi:glucose/arabinose dehydrogenase